MGYEACVNWSFPEALTLPIKYHHQPDSADANALSHIVYTANAVAIAGKDVKEGKEIPEEILDRSVLEELHLNDEDFNPILTEAEKNVDELTEQLGAA